MAILNVPRTAQEIVQKLCVIIMSHEIHEPFLNVKSAENVVEVCGTNGLCSQPVSGNDQPHVCSCDSGTWWTTGGNFGESRDPCKPVKNEMYNTYEFHTCKLFFLLSWLWS